MIRFKIGNAKIASDTAIFDLPAGYTCPGADVCHSRSNRKTGKVQDGTNCQIRCYAAQQEAYLPALRRKRWDNFLALKGQSVSNIASMINRAIADFPAKVRRVRIHESGDFFSQDYFDAWLEVAKQNKSLVFYAYTKSIPFWVARKNELPKNFRLVASYGGKFDSLIQEHGLKSAHIVFSRQEAKSLGLPIDKTDRLAYTGKRSFALLLHGCQPAGSEASKAWEKIRWGEGGYAR